MIPKHSVTDCVYIASDGSDELSVRDSLVGAGVHVLLQFAVLVTHAILVGVGSWRACLDRCTDSVDDPSAELGPRAVRRIAHRGAVLASRVARHAVDVASQELAGGTTLGFMLVLVRRVIRLGPSILGLAAAFAS